MPDQELPPLFEEFTPLFNDFRGHPLAVKNAFLLAVSALEAGLHVDFSRSQKGVGAALDFYARSFDTPRFIRITDPKKPARGVFFDGSCALETMSAQKFQRVNNKLETKKVFHEAGVLSPFGGTATAQNLRILDTFRRKGVEKVVVKPVAGSLSKGVLTNVELGTAARHIRSMPRSVFLVEQPIPGREFRTLVIDGKMLAAFERAPVCVVGDGRSTVRALIEAENDYRARHPEFAERVINVDTAALAMAAIGKSLDAVPLAGARVIVTLSTTTGRSTIFSPVPEADLASLARASEAAAKALKLRFTGLDIRFDTQGRPFVLEANGRPGTSQTVFRYREPGWNLRVPRALVSMMLPKAKWDGRVVRRFEFAALHSALLDPEGKGVVAARDFVEIA